MNDRKTLTKVLQGVLTIAVAVCAASVGPQPLSKPEVAEAVQPLFPTAQEWVPLAAEIPQGRLFCSEGTLAYRRLLPDQMKVISREEALATAKEGAVEACDYGWKGSACKEALARVKQLRKTIHECNSGDRTTS